MFAGPTCFQASTALVSGTSEIGAVHVLPSADSASQEGLSAYACCSFQQSVWSNSFMNLASADQTILPIVSFGYVYVYSVRRDISRGPHKLWCKWRRSGRRDIAFLQLRIDHVKELGYMVWWAPFICMVGLENSTHWFLPIKSGNTIRVFVPLARRVLRAESLSVATSLSWPNR